MPFLKYDDQGKGNAIMTTHLKTRIEKADEKMQEVEASIDRMAWQVHNLFKSKNFYD